MADRRELLADLAVEGEALDAVVAGLEDSAWLRPTPAAGWTIAHQIAHLAWTDEWALAAARDPAAFVRSVTGAGDSCARPSTTPRPPEPRIPRTG